MGGEQTAGTGPDGAKALPETAIRTAWPPSPAAYAATYAAISACRRFAFNAKHTKLSLLDSTRGGGIFDDRTWEI